MKAMGVRELLLTVTNWGQTEDGRWYCHRIDSYALDPARVVALPPLLKRNPQRMEELGIG